MILNFKYIKIDWELYSSSIVTSNLKTNSIFSFKKKHFKIAYKIVFFINIQ